MTQIKIERCIGCDRTFTSEKFFLYCEECRELLKNRRDDHDEIDRLVDKCWDINRWSKEY